MVDVIWIHSETVATDKHLAVLVCAPDASTHISTNGANTVFHVVFIVCVDVAQRKSGLQNRRGTSGRDLGADGFGTAARTRIIDRTFPVAA